MQRLNNTIWLSLLTMVLTYLIALPLGMIAGRYQNSLADKIIGVYNFLTFSTPTFVFAILMLWMFGFSLGWFPTRGSIRWCGRVCSHSQSLTPHDSASDYNGYFVNNSHYSISSYGDYRCEESGLCSYSSCQRCS